MQQAYQALRIVAEAQTIRVILASQPDELMLRELATACATLGTESSNGVKAVVFDFTMETQSSTISSMGEEQSIAPDVLDKAIAGIHHIPQPVLAVIRANISATASVLVHAADLSLVAQHATLNIAAIQGPQNSQNPTGQKSERLTGAQAVRLGYVTWSVPAHEMNKEMERILDMLRAKSAVALRCTKASVRLADKDSLPRQEALRQVNALYLTQLTQTHDAQEGLQAFLEKRKPHWENQ